MKDERLKKIPEENREEYIWRVGHYAQSSEYTWDELAEIINEELGLDEEEWLSSSAYRKPFQSALRYYQNVFSAKESDDFIKELKEAKRELEKAKVKLRTEKIEYNRWLREDARDEAIMEHIVDAIKELKPLDIPEAFTIPPTSEDKQFLLCFGDEHYGTEFELKGFFDDVINAYNPEIFAQRMWKLLEKIKKIIVKENIHTLKIFSMGDFTDGCLRTSQLMKLRYGVVESTIKYADFICNWLNELSNYVYIEFHQAQDANHEELRMLGQPKGTFPEDNMGKIIKEFIKVRMKNNMNFRYVENSTKFMLTNMCGFNVVGTHGDTKNLEKLIDDISTIYKINIDYILAGHLHHSKVEELGKCKEAINIPSIIGTDSYSLSLGKSSSSSAKLLVFEEKLGKTIEYTIKLD